MSGQSLLQKSATISSLLARVGAVALMCMMFLTAADVIGRYVFNAPVMGAYEMTEFLVLILIFSYLAFTQAAGTHVSVELIFNFLPKPAQKLIDILNHTVSLLIWALVAWKGLEKALEQMSTGEISPNLSVPDYPFAFFLALGCLVMCIEYIRNIIQAVTPKQRG